jgi:hypothetical protein
VNDATKRCPMCGEEILAVAIKCKHCHSMLTTAPTAEPGTVGAKANGALGSVMASVPAGAKGYLVAGLIMVVPALASGAFAGGWIASRDFGRIARQTGHGLTAEDVSEMHSFLTGGEGPAWGAGAYITALLVWAVGTAALGGWLRSKWSSPGGNVTAAPEEPAKPMSERAQSILFISIIAAIVAAALIRRC